MITFERLTEANYKAVAQLDKKCLPNEFWSEQLFFQEIYDKNKFYIVAKDVDNIIAFGGYAQILDEGNILNIAVDENYRRQGIANKILNILLENGFNNGITAFTLEVRESNTVARLLYEKAGFKFVGKRKSFYNDKEDACIYWLYK